MSAEDQAISARVQARLDALGEPYKRIDIDPAYTDTAGFCERYGYALEESVNAILVAAKTGPRHYAACLVQATRRLDVNRTVRRLMSVRRASFASAQETTAETGMIPGGVTPFGLPGHIPVYVDAPVMACAQVILGGGGRDTKIQIAPRVLTRLPNTTVVEDLSLPQG